MMLAKTENVDILHNNQLIVILVKNSPVDQIPHVLFVTLCEEHHGLCVSIRRAQKTFAVWVFTDAFEDRAYGAGEFL